MSEDLISESGSTALPHRIARRDTLHLVGVEEFVPPPFSEQIKGLWRKFLTRHVEITSAINQPPVALASLHCPQPGFDYLCAMQVPEPVEPPTGMTLRSVPPAEYAIFRHAGPVSTIAQTYERIYGPWSVADKKPVQPGWIIELFLPAFNPATGEGGVEIWVAVEDI